MAARARRLPVQEEQGKDGGRGRLPAYFTVLR